MQGKRTETWGKHGSLAYWLCLSGSWELHGQMTDAPPAQALGREEVYRQQNSERLADAASIWSGTSLEASLEDFAGSK